MTTLVMVRCRCPQPTIASNEQAIAVTRSVISA
jgi:hypothetical protein